MEKTRKGVDAKETFSKQNNLTKRTGCLNKYNETVLY